MRWLEGSASVADPDIVYVPDAAQKVDANAIPTFVARGRTLSYDDLGRCATLLKDSGFPKPYYETGGQQVPGHPDETTVTELKRTRYSDDRLRQCLGALDKIAPYEDALVADVETAKPQNGVVTPNSVTQAAKKK